MQELELVSLSLFQVLVAVLENKVNSQFQSLGCWEKIKSLKEVDEYERVLIYHMNMNNDNNSLDPLKVDFFHDFMLFINHLEKQPIKRTATGMISLQNTAEHTWRIYNLLISIRRWSSTSGAR